MSVVNHILKTHLTVTNIAAMYNESKISLFISGRMVCTGESMHHINHIFAAYDNVMSNVYLHHLPCAMNLI